MFPILFSLGRVHFYTQGIFIALGALLGGGTIFYLTKKEKLSTTFLIDILIYSLLAGLIGARLAYVVIYYYHFGNWQEMFLPQFGGLVSFGGIFFGFLVAGLVLRRRRQNVSKWFDLGIIGFLVGWAIGKIGGLLSGDTPGISYVGKIAIGGQLPVALFEAIWCVLVASLLFLLIIKGRKMLARLPDGSLFFSGLFGYFLGGFILDFWRQDTVSGMIFWHLKAGQWANIVVLLGILFYFFVHLKIKKGAPNA